MRPTPFRLLFAMFRRLAYGLGYLMILVTLTPICYWWTEWYAGPQTNARGDVLVLLGGDVEPGAILGYSSFTRCVYALYAWREGGFRNIIVSGGKGGNETAVAEAMSQFLQAEGVPKEALVLETQSSTTRENIQFLKPLLQKLGGRAVLMTSDFHMRRALALCRREGIIIEPRPAPTLESLYKLPWERWRMFTTLTVESAKSLYYFARGWT